MPPSKLRLGGIASYQPRPNPLPQGAGENSGNCRELAGFCSVLTAPLTFGLCVRKSYKLFIISILQMNLRLG
jgi:hypothetical protein